MFVITIIIVLSTCHYFFYYYYYLQTYCYINTATAIAPDSYGSFRESRRNGAYSLVAEPAVRGESAEAINEAFLDRPVVEAFNSAMTSSLDSTPDTPSSVSQRAAFFAQVDRKE